MTDFVPTILTMVQQPTMGATLLSTTIARTDGETLMAGFSAGGDAPLLFQNFPQIYNEADSAFFISPISWFDLGSETPASPITASVSSVPSEYDQPPYEAGANISGSGYPLWWVSTIAGTMGLIEPDPSGTRAALAVGLIGDTLEYATFSYSNVANAIPGVLGAPIYLAGGVLYFVVDPAGVVISASGGTYETGVEFVPGLAAALESPSFFPSGSAGVWAFTDQATKRTCWAYAGLSAANYAAGSYTTTVEITASGTSVGVYTLDFGDDNVEFFPHAQGAILSSTRAGFVFPSADRTKLVCANPILGTWFYIELVAGDSDSNAVISRVLGLDGTNLCCGVSIDATGVLYCTSAGLNPEYIPDTPDYISSAGGLSPVMATPIAALVPNAMQQFTDGNGNAIQGGFVYMFVPGTMVPKTTWSDPLEASPNPNPIPLDAAGRAIIYGNGQYSQLVTDKFGNVVWNQLTQDPISETLANVNISSAMQPVVSAASIADAVGLLNLSLGLVIPCTATVAASAITLTRATATNPVPGNTPGVNYSFWCPSAVTGPITIQNGSDGTAEATLYDSPAPTTGAVQTAGLVDGQFCIVAWNDNLECWVLINPDYNISNEARFAEFTSGTNSWVAPVGISEVFATGCGGGGGGGGGGPGGGSTTTYGGGGGGGGAAAVSALEIGVTAGGTYSITIGTLGLGGAQSFAGSTGGTTTMVDSSFSTLVALSGGIGGGAAVSGGSSTAGAAGGSGGQPGQVGHYFGTTNPAVGGFGGGALNLGAGGSSGVGDLPGGTCSGYGGGGGGGGSGASSVANPGGAGGSGFLRLEW